MSAESIQLITKNNLGELTYCNSCNCYNLTFANFSFEFKDKQLQRFKSYIFDVNEDYWCNKEYNTAKKRRIPIHTAQQNLTLFFNKSEFYALKDLLKLNCYPFKELSILDIDYPLALN